jgi:hypothetical protein
MIPEQIVVVSTGTLWLMAGGAVGALLIATATRGQKKFGWETRQDCFIGMAIGGLWTVPMFGVWPPFELSHQASHVQRALLVGVFTIACLRIIKKMLFAWAPMHMKRLLARDGVRPPASQMRRRC